jgi:hypothetical protein
MITEITNWNAVERCAFIESLSASVRLMPTQVSKEITADELIPFLRFIVFADNSLLEKWRDKANRVLQSYEKLVNSEDNKGH